MLCRAIDRGVSKERLARAFVGILSPISRRARRHLPGAIARLQAKQVTHRRDSGGGCAI